MKIIQFQVIPDILSTPFTEPVSRDFDRVYALTECGRLLYYDPTRDKLNRWIELITPGNHIEMQMMRDY